jgi:hypothetical protein
VRKQINLVMIIFLGVGIFSCKNELDVIPHPQPGSSNQVIKVSVVTEFANQNSTFHTYAELEVLASLEEGTSISHSYMLSPGMTEILVPSNFNNYTFNLKKWDLEQTIVKTKKELEETPFLHMGGVVNARFVDSEVIYVKPIGREEYSLEGKVVYTYDNFHRIIKVERYEMVEGAYKLWSFDSFTYENGRLKEYSYHGKDGDKYDNQVYHYNKNGKLAEIKRTGIVTEGTAKFIYNEVGSLLKVKYEHSNDLDYELIPMFSNGNIISMISSSKNNTEGGEIIYDNKKNPFQVWSIIQWNDIVKSKNNVLKEPRIPFYRYVDAEVESIEYHEDGYPSEVIKSYAKDGLSVPLIRRRILYTYQ